MSRRHFHDTYRSRRYHTHHYREETAEGLFEAKVENFIINLLKRIFRRNA